MSFFKKRNNFILNGWKFELIIDNSVFNISHKIKEKVNSKKIFEVNQSFDFKKFIKSYDSDYKKSFLRITNKLNKNWDPLTIKEFTPFKINLGDINFNKKLEIVYFINSDLNNSFFKLFKDQLKDLIRSKIFKYKFIKFYLVIICSSYSKRAKINEIINSLKLSNFFDFDLYFSEDTNKEYEGINKVWKISKNDEEKLILYFHGKGISYIANPFFYIRQPLERFIFKRLIHNWEKNLEKIFRLHSINKIGILSGGNGWLWFNFWIARSSYLSRLERPKITKKACYYEDWLGRSIIDKSFTENLSNKKKLYINDDNEKFYNTLSQTLSILDNPNKNKFNLGTACEVKSGGFVGLGIYKYSYRLWYLFYVVLNKIGINKGQKDRFMFY